MTSASRLRTVLLLALVTAIALAASAALRVAHDDSRRDYLDADGWPRSGQAAFVLGHESARASGGQRAVPIASLAKVMTAYLVLREDPIPHGEPGFTILVTPSDVADTHLRRLRAESVVAVRAGERLSERQALAALLLPSANNVALMLARAVMSSVAVFVAEMNRTARAVGMRHTTYTDPSGFDDGTRSTAADQLILAQLVMRVPTFHALVALRTYRLPVAGKVHTTDRLVGTDGFAGIKTGSTDAAGGCFMFLSRRVVHGAVVNLYGVVLGQPGHNLVAAGQFAAKQLVDRVAPVYSARYSR